MAEGALLIEERRGEDGKPVTLYHFTNPETEKEFIRRIEAMKMSPEEAMASLCQCLTHRCLVHGDRLQPSPRRREPPTKEETGSAMMIRVARDEHGVMQTSYLFTRLDLVEECKKRVAAGMTEEQAYHSMCQCDFHDCETHGQRRPPPKLKCYD
jgi:hypothetical protein